MSQTSSNKIEEKILKSSRGELFFAEDFSIYASDQNVRKILSRLEKNGVLKRLAHGIYLKPKTDPMLGVLHPSIEEIAYKIAKRDKARIVPTGIWALYQLGLTTQIPLKAVYLTDGSQRIIKIDNRTIQFKKTVPKNLAVKSDLLHLIIQSFREVGQKNLNESFIEKIIPFVKRLDESVLGSQLKYAPAWIRNEILTLHKTNNYVD